MDPTAAAEQLNLYAVVVTCARPTQLLASLERLSRSSLVPKRIVVVDNHRSEGLEQSIAEQIPSLAIDLVVAPENLGPAGGRSFGFEQLGRLVRLQPDDWVAFIDDDEPLPHCDTLERLFVEAVEWAARDGRAAGLGLAGARFDAKRVVNRRVDVESGEHADNLHGWAFPLYRVGPFLAVEGFDPSLFFGSEELDLGLRLTDAGYGVRVHEELAAELHLSFGRPPTVSASAGLDAVSWKRYYSLRNILVLARRHGGTAAAGRVAVVRGIGKPLVNLPTQPRRAVQHLAMNTRAISDAVRGRSGRTIAPDLNHRRWDHPGVSVVGWDHPHDGNGDRATRGAADRARVVDLLLADRLDARTATRLLIRSGVESIEAERQIASLAASIEAPTPRWGVGAPFDAGDFYDDAGNRLAEPEPTEPVRIPTPTRVTRTRAS